MNPSEQGKAQAQRTIERMMAEALEGCGYEDEAPGTATESVAAMDRLVGEIIADRRLDSFFRQYKKEKWFQKIWQRLKK